MFKNILVAIDSVKIDDSHPDYSALKRSDMECFAISRHVFDEALSIAKANNARLVLLHILSPEEENLLPHSDIPGDELNEAFEREVKKPLKLLEHEAINTKIDADSHYDSGDPGVQICQWAEIWEADLIIMGRRGRSGLQEMLLGSVSNYVLNNAPCSVFITHRQVSVSPVEEG